MRITHTNQSYLEAALAETNRKFDNNITFNNFQQVNKAGTIFQVTLRVKSSKGKGARLSPPQYPDGKQRRLIAACWHVYGTFFDNLNPNAVIYTSRKKIHPGDAWQDWNIGSTLWPYDYSDACFCE